MKLVVKTQGLIKTYMQGKVPVKALRGVNFHVKDGEFVAIIGPSGSGKSTLLNMIGALDLPTEGKVFIGDDNISEMNGKQLSKLRQQIGFVFQFFNLIPRLTAFQNVELTMSIQKIPKKQRIRKTEQYLRMVGLGDRMHHKPTELSGGQQQRVAIARALAQEPKFLLMDEPTGNVDTKTRDMIMNLIVKLNKLHGISIILITHDNEIARRAKRIVRIIDGKIVTNLENVDSPANDIKQSEHELISITSIKEGI